MEGIIKAEENNFIEFEISGGVVRLQKDEIEWTVKSSENSRKELREKWADDQSGGEEKIDQQSGEENPAPGAIGFTRNRQGMLVNAVVDNKINLKLVLDTGASLVILRKSLADGLGLDLDNLKPDTQTVLADGTVCQAKHIELYSLKIGDWELKNVDAAILVEDTKEDQLGDGLLGMSFLGHFNFKIDQKENKLILEELPESTYKRHS